ncbi:MAG: ATP-binding protein, partial [Sciscionella sp.]
MGSSGATGLLERGEGYALLKRSVWGSTVLLERDDQVEALLAAVSDAAGGRSGAVLVTGEAGIGKTSVLRAFLATVGDSVPVLYGACDDLSTPRTLGPLRDAAAGTGGPLERALAADGAGERVFAAAVEELSGSRPTVLMVEDVHWADDATLDVLRHVAGRLDRLRTLLVLTFRDDSVGAGHPLQQLLATLGRGGVRRLSLPPLSPTAVKTLCSTSGRDATELRRLTGGNPLYLTEVLAAPREDVPATVMNTVLAKVRRLGPSARAAVEQLSVLPSPVDAELGAVLFRDGLQTLGEAEEDGVVELRADGVVFRHELARRAVEHGLPAIRRCALNGAVVRALLAVGQPDIARLVHHAVEAGDIATVLHWAPLAGLQAARAGSHRQALAHFETALRYADRMPEADRAALVDDYGWELHVAHRFAEAVHAGREAVRLRERLEQPVALGETLLRLSRHLYLSGHTDDAEAAVERAARVLEPAGSTAALARAGTYRGAILALTGRSVEAVAVLEHARGLAAEADRGDLVALCLNYLGVARTDLGQPDGLRYLRDSLSTALSTGDDESVASAYTNLGELLYRFGESEELLDCIRDGLEFTRERGLWSHAYNLEVHAALLRMRCGDWADAERRLTELVHDVPEPGMLYVYSVPALARLRACRGEADAEPLLTEAWQRAQRQRSLPGLTKAGIARAEWAWLTGRQECAAEVRDVLLPRTELPGAAPLRGELLRYLARAGLDVEPFDGCPPGYAAGLRGDWRAAAAEWERAGDRYEQALELAESGEVAPTLEALRILHELGAAPAVALVRRRLKDLGLQRIPRGPQPVTQANPAGLTRRQVDVLTLLATGLTNAEIAERLVVSVRTVDHHVSAILARLGVRTRRAA